MDLDNGDALVGLRFEVSGGLGKMSGRVLGKAGGLYLVQKEGAAYLELLALDDLRSAKFFADAPVERTEAEAEDKTIELPVASPAATAPSRRRLADQIRKRLGGA